MAIQIDRTVRPRKIMDVAEDLGLSPEDLELYGSYMAKISMPALKERLRSEKRGKLILVTAITPTRFGEGKTTVAIGLAQALWQLDKKAVAVLREPSLGPVFGIKGGATGGGLCELRPKDDINLHFTGDLHAVTSANNLLAACIDNHLFHGNELEIDQDSVFLRRAVDMNDRSLREIETGLGRRTNGLPRKTGFNITAAAEIMAILCLSESISDLKRRIGRMVIGQNKNGDPVTGQDLGIAGAMAALLRHAIKPNLVQTTEGSPVIVHGGPFANIAHGCSSILSIKLALSLADIIITEAGFGSDLGFEKYCDIVAGGYPELIPDAVVLVATVKALKLHGGESQKNLSAVNCDAVRAGLHNLDSHVAILGRAGLPFVIAINKFDSDTSAEIQVIGDHCDKMGWHFAINDTFHFGGVGGVELANKIELAIKEPQHFRPFYAEHLSVAAKIETLATKVYNAECTEFSARTIKQLSWLDRHGYGNLPVCIAKNQYALIENRDGTSETICGSTNGGVLKISELRLSAGAGFVVALSGNIMTMPGLPKHPAALDMDVDDDGQLIQRRSPS